MKILHIAAHLGGGAGKAISGAAILGQRLFGDIHRILLLQQPEKTGYVEECRENHVAVTVWKEDQTPLNWADVIVVSWWNHPSMARFLYELPPLSGRIVLWSHVNGCHYPYLPFAFADAFDGILLTSPYSLKNPAWTEAERIRIRERARIVYGMGAFYPEQIKPKEGYVERACFTVGYVGTLNYGKLHPKFVTYCQEVRKRISSVRFVMAGDRNSQLEHDVQEAGLADCFSFPGFVSDVPDLMRAFDVFGYLLNPNHYGTTENTLLEAMTCGIPVVALRQNVEQYIIPEDAGYLIEDPRQYGEALEKLHEDSARREAMGRCGRRYVQETFSAEVNAAVFRDSCESAIGRNKKPQDFSFTGETPWQWFLFFAGTKNQKLFEKIQTICNSRGAAESTCASELLRTCPPIFREERKSSLRHFAAVYPEDPELRTLDGLIAAYSENRA